MISLPITSLPDANEQLYAMFPQLQERVKEAKLQEWESEKETPYVAIYLVDSPSAEKVMRLLLPDGQEISFEGMGISYLDSIDEKRHKVDSFEEYQQYQKSIKKFIEGADIYPIFKSNE